MASRAYRRDSRGRFAGGGGGTRVTYGRAGGFAKGNTFGARTRVAGGARSTGRGRMKALGGTAKRAAMSRQGQYAIKLTAAGLGAAAAGSLASRGSRAVLRSNRQGHLLNIRDSFSSGQQGRDSARWAGKGVTGQARGFARNYSVTRQAGRSRLYQDQVRGVLKARGVTGGSL